MGQAQSTLLSLVLNHFKDFCQVTEDSSLVVCPLKLTIFCRNEWPAHGLRRGLSISPSFTGWRFTFWDKCHTSPHGNTWLRSPLFGWDIFVMGLAPPFYLPVGSLSSSLYFYPCPASTGRGRSSPWLPWLSWLHLEYTSHSGPYWTISSHRSSRFSHADSPAHLGWLLAIAPGPLCDRREIIVRPIRELIPVANGLPTQVQVDIDAAFPLTRPDWHFNTAEGKEKLCVSRQILMGVGVGLV